MYKRALMLTAATVALLSGQSIPAAAATCDAASSTASLCDIKTVVVTPIATSTVQTGGSDVTIETSGGINVTVAGAALKIDSNNDVINFGNTAGFGIMNKGTTGAIGVELVAGNTATPGTTTGSYNGLLGIIDLTGSGTGKTGFLIDLPTGVTTGTFDASTFVAPATAPIGITLGTVNVVGDQSFGVHIMPGVTLKGPLLLDGAVTVTASSTSSTSTTSDTGVEIDGSLNGNLTVAAGASIVATGAGSRGLVILGPLTGSFFNGGSIEAVGITTPSTTAANPEGSTAFVLAGSVSGGIYNSGPIAPGESTPRGLMVVSGTGPAVLISPSAGGITVPAPINIGVYGDSTISNPGYSFYNRGTINSTPADSNFGSVGMRIVGDNNDAVNFAGLGIFNSGSIGASAKTDTSGTGTATTALWIGDFVTVPTLNNSASSGANSGTITASVNGATAGQAIAILIDADTTGHGTLNSITNSGSILAVAQSSDTTINGLTAIAIWDKSGTLTSIVNTGTISAQTTQLDNNAQLNTALNAQANSTGVNFQNTGTVVGNIFFGNGNDVLNVSGTSTALGTVTGNISFLGGHDILSVGNNGFINGAVLSSGGGDVNISVGTGAGTGTGSLFINNTDAGHGVHASNLVVNSDGLLGISLSQAFNRTNDATADALIASTNSINLATGSQLDVTFGSFITALSGEAAKFVLFDAPTITIGDPDPIRTSITATIPFLYVGNVCAYGIGNFVNTTPAACTDTPAHDQLVLSLTPKTADQLQLTGYANTIFPLANAALAHDNVLGSAVIAAGTGLTGTAAEQTAKGNAIYQSIYSQFAPEVTGAARALAVSLTDSATSAVGARQRTLRMYAGKNGSMSLWGQEFVQRLNNATNMPNGYRNSGFGFALGADGGSAASGRFGAALTFFSGDITEKLPAQVKTSSEWYMLSGYSDWRGKGLFFDSQVTAGYGNLNGKRSLTIDNASGTQILGRTASSKRASLLAAGGFSTGAILAWGSNVLTPQISVDALTLRENGYSETGGGPGFDLKVDPYYAKSLRGYLGASARKDISFGDFYLQPEARIGYRYDFLGDPVKLKAAFAGDPSVTPVIAPGAQFSLTGPDPARGSLVAGAGIAATTGAWSLGLNYDYLRGGGSTAMAGTITLLGRI